MLLTIAILPAAAAENTARDGDETQQSQQPQKRQIQLGQLIGQLLGAGGGYQQQHGMLYHNNIQFIHDYSLVSLLYYYIKYSIVHTFNSL